MANAKRKIDLNYDPYKTLGIELSSSERVIDKAYKKLALKWHPDKNKDNLEEAQKKFVELYKAYDFLKNKEQKTEFDEAVAAKKKRAAYDDQRKATSSAKRKYFIDKLQEKEQASEPRQASTSKPAKDRTKTEEELLLKKFRREGAQLLKQMEEERIAAMVSERKREEERRQREHAEAVKATTHPHVHMYDMSVEDMDALEKEILGI